MLGLPVTRQSYPTLYTISLSLEALKTPVQLPILVLHFCLLQDLLIVNVFSSGRNLSGILLTGTNTPDQDIASMAGTSITSVDGRPSVTNAINSIVITTMKAVLPNR
jgi:hypothetical protein